MRVTHQKLRDVNVWSSQARLKHDVEPGYADVNIALPWYITSTRGSSATRTPPPAYEPLDSWAYRRKPQYQPQAETRG
jgi:hypothetical protein